MNFGRNSSKTACDSVSTLHTHSFLRAHFYSAEKRQNFIRCAHKKMSSIAALVNAIDEEKYNYGAQLGAEKTTNEYKMHSIMAIEEVSSAHTL